ncbi:hypothetical protein F4813DRAFT_340881 [Daldinia decipiens]|uniref:uncharacterized protein n=1 Tax=Daldinia decipiens TaxID=326647 RepID=UPI0020C28560|nr:uncharacterized protein F4813DRAFT_340881 [Daldinia decipiens]KAI1662507.1 hypothetical protein F4813DRAFT_340881 [Daldinia decipiens]
MANESRSYLCGLFRIGPRPAPRPAGDDGLRGVEFSPRSSIASSVAPTVVTSPLSQLGRATTVLDNPELAGYYSPPGPRAMLPPNPSQELRGYYAPEPVLAPAVQPRIHPTKVAYS